MLRLAYSKIYPNQDKATFVIKIASHQNATWQGSVRWMEGGDSQNFRSLLELIKLLESVFGNTAAEKTNSF